MRRYVIAVSSPGVLDMRIQRGELISLGYGKFVHSDDVVAIEPIVEGRGPGHRTSVWVRGIAQPFVASRSEEAIAQDLVAPRDEAARALQLTTVLEHITASLAEIPPVLLRVLQQETGQDFSALISNAKRALG